MWVKKSKKNPENIDYLISKKKNLLNEHRFFEKKNISFINILYSFISIVYQWFGLEKLYFAKVWKHYQKVENCIAILYKFFLTPEI